MTQPPEQQRPGQTVTDNLEVQPPVWLQQAWAGAKQRGVDRLTQDGIDAEIVAHRKQAL